MARAKWGYVWIAGIVRILEVRYGPFWEPSRARAAVEPEAILRSSDELEILLTRLAVGRAKSLAITVGLTVLVGAMIFATPRLPSRVTDWLIPVLVAAFFVVTMWVELDYWKNWHWVLWASYTLPPSSPAPLPDELVEAMRKMCDDLTFVGDGPAAAVLAEMRARSPLAFRMCMNTTIVNSVVKRRLNAA